MRHRALKTDIVLLCVTTVAIFLFGYMAITLASNTKSLQKASHKAANKAKPSSIREWSREIVELRSQIEILSSELQAQRTQYLQELQTLSAQRRQLILSRDGERMRLYSIQGQLRNLQAKLDSQRDQRDNLRSAIVSGVDSLVEAIEQGLPFRIKQRTDAPKQLKERLLAKQIEPEVAATRLWRLLEDELRLTALVERSEISLSLEPNTTPRLVQVVRLGMLTIFTSLPHNQYGRFVQIAPRKWQHIIVQDRAHIAQIRLLFQSLDKQIREGFYLLPLQPAIRPIP